MTLARYLDEQKCSVQDFADQIGVSRQTIHRYVIGVRFPRNNVIRQIEVATHGAVAPLDWYSQSGERAA